MTGESITAVMTRYNRLWEPGGTQHADEVIDPDFIRHGSSGALRGVAAFVRYVSHYLEAFPDLAFAVDDWFAARDRLWVRYSFTGTHVRPFMGVAATGRKVSADGVAIYRVEDHKLVEVWDYLDLFGLAERLGAPLPTIDPEVSLK